MKLYRENATPKYQDVELTDTRRLEYHPFVDKGIGSKTSAQKIGCQWVYDVKPHHKQKACVVANRNLHDPRAKNIYSGDISLRVIRLIVSLYEFNASRLWGAGVRNDYFEAKIIANVLFVGNTEFTSLDINTLMHEMDSNILNSYSFVWQNIFIYALRAIKCILERAGANIWMYQNDSLYMYTGFSTDEIMIAPKDQIYYLNDNKKKQVDIMRNNWTYHKVWHCLEPLLFYSGDTDNLINHEEKENNEIK
jgi:hypothetical protein